jgi:hypothetical protein
MEFRPFKLGIGTGKMVYMATNTPKGGPAVRQMYRMSRDGCECGRIVRVDGCECGRIVRVDGCECGRIVRVDGCECGRIVRVTFPAGTASPLSSTSGPTKPPIRWVTAQEPLYIYSVNETITMLLRCVGKGRYSSTIHGVGTRWRCS